MSDQGMNSAEAAAEEILKGAYAEARAEACPQGDDCAVHFRKSEDFVHEESQYVRMIDYVGEFVVITDDNPESVSVLTLVRAALGSLATIPPRWETSIYFVGEGVIGDLSEKSIEERRQAHRYQALHDDWEGVKNFHEVTVMGLKQGMIDVSKPVE